MIEIVYGRPWISSVELGDILWSKRSTHEMKLQAIHDYKWGPTSKETLDAWEARPIQERLRNFYLDSKSSPKG